MRALAFLVLLVLLPGTASAAEWVTIAQGKFVVGSPVAMVLFDACSARTWGVDASDGVDSDCFDIPAVHAGREFSFRFWGEQPLMGVSLCFFDASWRVSECVESSNGVIPTWAAHASVSAMGGTDIRWRLNAWA